MRKGDGLFAMIVCVLMCACQPSAGYVSGAAPAEDYLAVTRVQVAEHLKQWRAHKFRNYTVIYSFVEDTSGPGVLTLRSVTIRNNSVLDTRCATGGCPYSFLKDLRFIPELYDLIAALPDRCLDQVQFDREYHYPAFVSANCASNYAHPFSIHVNVISPE